MFKKANSFTEKPFSRARALRIPYYLCIMRGTIHGCYLRLGPFALSSLGIGLVGTVRRRPSSCRQDFWPRSLKRGLFL
jgi:hypothetical protein